MNARKFQTVSTTHFYNEIAPKYDELMGSLKDTEMRKELASYFKSNVGSGSVLDFGGGTGLDLPWLLDSGYHVFFCEPASAMKARAEELIEKNTFKAMPVFLPPEKSDFRLWDESNLPFEGELNTVLANFGVINYVKDLPLLFEKFNFLLTENGSIIASLLYANPRKLFTKYFVRSIIARIKGEKVKTGSEYAGKRHETFLYSIKDIKNASKEYFTLKTFKPLRNSDFLLLHLVKK